MFSCCLTTLAGTASADVISDWNVIGLQEAVAAERQGGAPAIDLATMHAAMYDAVQAIEKDYEPYRVTDVPNTTGIAHRCSRKGRARRTRVPIFSPCSSNKRTVHELSRR